MLYTLFNLLREHPTLALFLTLGLGFGIGRIRLGSFSLGSVTAVLLVGVLVGQLDIPVSGPLKMMFFMMFLFSIGYSVGPDFFKSLRGQGARQALFAVCMSIVCFLSTFAMAKVFQYTKGETVGLFSGSQTCSALLGVGSEALERLGLPAAELKQQLDIIPVCYAVTYIFGTLGTVILLGNLGPRLLGGIQRVKQQTAELERRLNAGDRSSDPSYQNALNVTAYRSYVLDSIHLVTPRTVRETELLLHHMGIDVYIDRVMQGGRIFAPRHDDCIVNGDEVVVCGRREYIVGLGTLLGPETSNTQLLSYPLDRVKVLVVKNEFTGIPLTELRKRQFMHGVVIRDAEREGQPLEIEASTEFRRGDRLTLVGQHIQVQKASKGIGHIDRPSIQSDIMFIGMSIFIGGLLGSMCFWIDGVPVSFGISGGALLAGLVFGWLRSKRPTYGYISPGALWIMNNLGLNVFIAVVGIEAAPSFVAGIKAVGPMLFAVGAIATVMPLLVGLFLGHKVFRFNPAITLGCCAGTRTCTASLGAVQNALGSTLPAIGYTVTYAVSNILLVVWGILTVILV